MSHVTVFFWAPPPPHPYVRHDTFTCETEDPLDALHPQGGKRSYKNKASQWSVLQWSVLQWSVLQWSVLQCVLKEKLQE